MKQLILAACISFSLIPLTTYAEGGDHRPCQPKAEAKHQAVEALHKCIRSWQEDRKPGDGDPSDDCSAKLSGFVSAAKDVKACREQIKKERDEKKQDKK